MKRGYLLLRDSHRRQQPCAKASCDAEVESGHGCAGEDQWGTEVSSDGAKKEMSAWKFAF